MPEVEILAVRDGGEAIVVHGTVDGAGYSATVPKVAVEAAATLADKRRVVARTLRDEWRRNRPIQSNLLGSVTVGDND